MNYFKKPWAHQLEAIDYSKDNQNVFLAWEMGTGKTATTINFLRARFYEHQGMLRTLVLCPKVVCDNWRRELETHAMMGHRHVRVLDHNSSKKKIEAFTEAITYNNKVVPGQGRVIITNYESVDNKELYQMIMSWKPQVLICDESHRVKNHKSKRAKAIHKIAQLTKHNYMLTGTPILNTPMDIFMQFKIMEANTPKDRHTFTHNNMIFLREWFEDKNASWKGKHSYFPDWHLRHSLSKKFNDKVSGNILRQTKEQCLDLPPLVRKKVFVDMTPEQKRAYKEMKNEFITYIGNEKKLGNAAVATLAITKSLRLQQIISGFVKTESGEEVTFDNARRVEVLRELVEEITPHHKLVVWANFRHNIRQISDLLDSMGVKHETLHGATKDKQGAIERFITEPGVRVFVGNQKAAGTGVDGLQHVSSYAVYFSRSYSLEDDLQSESRTHRGGSEKYERVTRIDIVSRGTIDELILEALEKKQNIADLILDWQL